MDYDRDGRVSPFGKPDDALGSSARFLVNRGKYHAANIGAMKCARPAPPKRQPQLRGVVQRRVSRADGQPFPQPNASAQMWVPMQGGPAFLLVRISTRCAATSLDELRAGDLPSRRSHFGRPPFIQPFPGSERALTLAEVQKCRPVSPKPASIPAVPTAVSQRHHESDQGLSDQMGLLPADGYGGLKVLARLRQGG